MNNLMGIIRQSAPSLGAEPYQQPMYSGQRNAVQSQRSGSARGLTGGAPSASGIGGASRADGAGGAQNAALGGTGQATPSPSALANKETFLTLLVAQIRNQNPLNPADGTEFLTQLAQFTQLEQLISIREELERVTQLPGPATTSAGERDGL